MNMLIRLLLTALTLLVLPYIVPGIAISSLYIAIIAAILLGLVNLVIKPILILLTLPINILTLGLFTFVINAALFWFVASFVSGFIVDGFLAALVGSLVVTVVSALGSQWLE